MFAFFVVQVQFFCTFLGTTRWNSTCHVPSLLHAGSRSSSSWRLQRTQTSTDSSINWFTDISLWTNNFFFSPPSSPLAFSGRDTNSCSLAETPHAGCGCSPGPVAPRPSGNTQHDMRLSLQPRALHRRDFLLHSSSASMSNPCDITSSVWASELPGIDPWPLCISLFFRNVYRWGSASDSVTNEMKPKLPANKLSRLTENKHLQPWNSFFPESYYTSVLFSSSPLPVALPLPHPPPLPVITRVVSAENSGEGEVHQQMAP